MFGVLSSFWVLKGEGCCSRRIQHLNAQIRWSSKDCLRYDLNCWKCKCRISCRFALVGSPTPLIYASIRVLLPPCWINRRPPTPPTTCYAMNQTLRYYYMLSTVLWNKRYWVFHINVRFESVVFYKWMADFQRATN